MSQIQKKFIADNAVDGSKLLLLNGQGLRAKNQAGSSEVSILQVNTSDQVEFQNIPYLNSGLPLPSAPKHLVTVEYIENVIKGRSDAKDAVGALADNNIALTGVAPFIIDGYTFLSTTPVGRVLLTGQSSIPENGIYDVTISGGNYALTRSSDFNTGTVTTGAYTFVINGTVYQGYEALLTTADPISVGTTPLNFAKYPSTVSLQAGDMLSKTNNIFSVDILPLGGLESTSPGNAAGQLRVKVDSATLENDKTTKIDSSSGAVVAKRSRKTLITLTATDITNGYVDLADVAGQHSVVVQPVGGPVQVETEDYTVNYTGGASSKTRILFAGGLATAGSSALVNNDKLVVCYTSF